MIDTFRKFSLIILSALALSTLSAQTHPSYIINVSGGESENFIYVEKSSQTLFVQRSFGPVTTRTLKSFKMTTGRVKGDKMLEGDMKTPEGIYYVQYEIPGGKLEPKYGPLAMVLDYPNPVDKLLKKTGSNIWIHGRDEEIRDLMTEGCISLDNRSTLQLEEFITHRVTPVIIADSLGKISGSERDKQSRYWASKLEDWRKNWAAGDVQRYLKHYSDSFVDEKGRDKLQFRLYKEVLAQRYEWVHIQLDDIVAYVHPREVHLHFQQEYESPVFRGTGRKVLVLVFDDSGEDGDWVILRESYRETEPRQYLDNELRDFVMRWRLAWETKNLTNYETFYSPNFNNGTLGFIQYMEYKKEKFSESAKLDIRLDDITVKNLGEDLWEVRFAQDYRADSYRDRGIKILTLREVNNVYFIIDEQWRAR